MSKPSPLPSPVSTITGRGGEEKEIKYKEPPSTEHLIHENFRALKCPIVPSRELRQAPFAVDVYTPAQARLNLV